MEVRFSAGEEIRLLSTGHTGSEPNPPPGAGAFFFDRLHPFLAEVNMRGFTAIYTSILQYVFQA
jgi:hypothetical protein